MRNLVHRSGDDLKPLDNSIKEVMKNKAIYYFKFYGYYSDLVENFIRWLAKEQGGNNNRDNTLGDSPQFKALSQKFNN